ncbi:IS1380 family transposase, partial [Halorhodospira halophila]|uniref:IS1380 family transposase n=1 Tax=Halorhodospira halophila TaxID=1053 RepID=UPI00191360E6
MGETVSLFSPSFNKALRVETGAQRLSSDAGAILQREALERTGIVAWLKGRLLDPRDPRRTRHTISQLLRDSLVMIGQGWDDQRDADTLRSDPILAACGSDGRGERVMDRTLASQPTISRLLDILAKPENQAVLDQGLLHLVEQRVRARNQGRRARAMTIDIDGVPLQAHGQQPGSAFSKYTGQRQHYPLFALCGETGDLVGVLLRPGNAGPASEAAAWIPKLVEYLRTHVAEQVRVRLDAGFADATTLAALDAHGIEFIARLPRNSALERRFEPHRYRLGRPSKREREWTDEFVHKAGTWERPRRVVMVIRERPGELFREAFYLVTNSAGSQRFVRRHYQQRGKAEAHFGEFKDVIGESLPCTRRGQATEEQAFARSQALLALRALAYQLLHVLRDSLERGTGDGWSLRRLREQVLKSAVRVQRHARRVHVILERRAASHWRALLRRLT